MKKKIITLFIAIIIAITIIFIVFIAFGQIKTQQKKDWGWEYSIIKWNIIYTKTKYNSPTLGVNYRCSIEKNFRDEVYIDEDCNGTVDYVVEERSGLMFGVVPSNSNTEKMERLFQQFNAEAPNN